MLLREQSSVRDLGMKAFVYTETGGVVQLLLDKVARECRPEGKDRQILRQVSLTQPSEQRSRGGKAVSTVRGLAGTFGSFSKTNISYFEVTTHSPMLPCRPGANVIQVLQDVRPLVGT